MKKNIYKNFENLETDVFCTDYIYIELNFNQIGISIFDIIKKYIFNKKDLQLFF